MNRELGFPSGVAYNKGAFGRGTGPVWLYRVECDGDEDTLIDCSLYGWENKKCRHRNDAGVRCRPSKYYRGMIPPFEMEQLSSF